MNLIKNMKNVEFHFALEGVAGKGKVFLLDCIKEVKIFKKQKLLIVLKFLGLICIG